MKLKQEFQYNVYPKFPLSLRSKGWWLDTEFIVHILWVNTTTNPKGVTPHLSHW